MKRFFKFMVKYRYVMFPVFAITALAIFGGALTLLWNWLMPSIFGLTAINFWQAIGLFVLARLLFSGMGFHKGNRRFRHHHSVSNAEREKWMAMSFEERREWFKQRRFERGCGFRSKFNKKESNKPENE
ncbi:hypothetical protein SAMN02927937_01750 [Paenimyroides aquimaris]|uniref:Uncharacterized protein n=1 Tax=Paenimyroides marinum TaxID=1159016 RepID=A0A1H6L9K6_9FLAO|nr:hypothetical protein [Paenimyroides aquimaris]SEH84914.1 hypothetical protein SAMN02927937_01750 [Paenimyroides aquimaris]